MATDRQATSERIAREIERVDRVLEACTRRNLDPVKVIERAVQQYDKRHQAAQKGAH